MTQTDLLRNMPIMQKERFIRLHVVIMIITLLSLPGCESIPDPSQTPTTVPSRTDSKKTKPISFWHELRADFKLDHATNHSAVRQQIDWYKTHQTSVNKTLNKAAPYLYYVFQQVKARHLPGELVLLPVIESDYDPFAYSQRGAAGLWQLMPGTATGYGLKEDWWYDGRRDISASTKAALDYMVYLDNFFNGNWLLAIAAYDSGEGTVQQAIDYNAHRGHSTHFWDLALPHETKAYVPRLLALAAIIAYPERYGIKLPMIKNGPFFAIVHIKKQLNLANAAKLAHISLTELYELNPGYNQWATDPNGPHHLLLPINKVSLFKKNLAKAIQENSVTWHHYRVNPGDNLASIAHKFHTRVEIVKKVNKLSNTTIYPKQTLLIPMNTRKLHRINRAPEISYAKTQQLNLGPRKLIHIVRKGESLWLVAKHYGLKISEIQLWNHLGRKIGVSIGQRLILWLPQHTHIPAPIHGFVTKPHSIVYHVKPGDTLSTIAHRYKLNVKDLKRANHLQSDTIRSHQKLHVPTKNILNSS